MAKWFGDDSVTCKDCVWRVNSECRRFPPQLCSVKDLHSAGHRTDTSYPRIRRGGEYGKACGEYTNVEDGV